MIIAQAPSPISFDGGGIDLLPSHRREFAAAIGSRVVPYIAATAHRRSDDSILTGHRPRKAPGRP